MKQQSRRWVYASVAAALLFTIIFFQLDNQKIYQSLQHELKRSGITLKAKNVSISPMYTGSILLNDVTVSSKEFQIQAGRIFIDLNLAALLTGKALPQALFIQLADIELQQSNQNGWLKLAESSQLKLKRIDISQSEIHLLDQHLTLEKVNLDLRDIGKNKNPRVELQAHIGEGRLDAHGYLRLKNGRITQGFGRLKVIDVPTTFMNHPTTLQTLNGSITTHLNPDSTWQSFGHLSLHKDGKSAVELRGKLVGSPEQFFHINDLILTIHEAGAIQLSGECVSRNNCLIESQAENLKLAPVWKLFSWASASDFSLLESNTGSMHIQSVWKNGTLANDVDAQGANFEYRLNQQPPQALKDLNIRFSNLVRSKQDYWQLETLKITDRDQGVLSVDHAGYENGAWQLPVKLEQSALLPAISNLVLAQVGIPHAILAQGGISGEATIKGNNLDIQETQFDIKAEQSAIDWHEFHKPEQVNLHLHGSASHLHEQAAMEADIALELATATAQLKRRGPYWQLEKLQADFNQLEQSGVHFPLKPHGSISGKASFLSDFSDINLASFDLNQFGIGEHILSGQIKKRDQRWKTNHLSWKFNKNIADISSDKKGNLNITASKIETDGLAVMQKLPLQLKGHINSKSLVLPFGILRDFSTRFETAQEAIRLQNVQATFYEGSVRSNEIEITSEDGAQHYKGQIQVGGIRLKDWRWFNKQFQTILKGNLYSTLNIGATFNNEQKLSEWKGDGDLLVYNGSWLLDNHELEARKLELSFKKRDDFKSRIKLTHKKQQGTGTLDIDQQNQCSGALKIAEKSYPLSGSWPLLRYE